ncbi:MAG: translation elongation factor Ts [Rhodopirellula sp.]|nr:translation elongation factor Ts [Rhodopirellula sp.]
MAEVTAAAVKALREKTTLPMMDCKKALVEADGDEARAIEILREQFKKIQIKRADNETTEGLIQIAVTDGGGEGVMVEVQCESAPVASSDEFRAFARQCANQLLNGPGAATAEELLSQPAPEVAGKTLQDVWEDITNQIREKIVVGRITRVTGPVNGYVHHDGKNGALFQAEGDSGNLEVLRDVAMHVTALRPLVCLPDGLAPADIEAERASLTAEAKASGKPDNIVDKIVDGRMKNYYVEQGVLTFQAFAKDDSKTVSQALAEAGYKAVAFTRWSLGN